MLVQQLHEYSFFQSLRHFQTIDLPESLAGICVASRLVDGEAVRLELFHHTLFHCLGRPFLVFQRVGNVEHMPFWTAKLVESKHIDVYKRQSLG